MPTPLFTNEANVPVKQTNIAPNNMNFHDIRQTLSPLKKENIEEKDIGKIRDAHNKMGVYLMTMKHSYNHYQKQTGETPNDDSETIFRGDKYLSARISAAVEFLEIELDIKNVMIRELKMCSNSESAIMWLNIDQYTIKNMFRRAEFHRLDTIRVINLFPPLMWKKESA